MTYFVFNLEKLSEQFIQKFIIQKAFEPIAGYWNHYLINSNFKMIKYQLNNI